MYLLRLHVKDPELGVSSVPVGGHGVEDQPEFALFAGRSGAAESGSTST